MYMRNTSFRVLHFRTYYTSGPARPLFFRLTLRFIYLFFLTKKKTILIITKNKSLSRCYTRRRRCRFDDSPGQLIKTYGFVSLAARGTIAAEFLRLSRRVRFVLLSKTTSFFRYRRPFAAPFALLLSAKQQQQ